VNTRDSRPTLRYEPPKIWVRALVAPAEVKDVGQRVVFLQILNQEVEQERLPGPGVAENQRVRDILVVQVQVSKGLRGRFRGRRGTRSRDARSTAFPGRS